MKNKTSLFLIVLLAVCAALITAAFFATRSKIKANETAKENHAIEEVFSDAVRYSDALYNETFLYEYLADNGIRKSDVIVNHVIYARDEQNVVKGLIVYVDAYKDYGGIISMAVGILNNGTVNGYFILSISDAKGLDRKVTEDVFKDQFIGKNVSSFVLSPEADSENAVLPANGAKDASQAVVNGINASIFTLEFIDESTGGLLG